MIATTFENTAEIETPKEEKKQSWLQSAFNAVASLGLFDGIKEMYQELKEDREQDARMDEYHRQENIFMLYEMAENNKDKYHRGNFEKSINHLLRINKNNIHDYGKITVEDVIQKNELIDPYLAIRKELETINPETHKKNIEHFFSHRLDYGSQLETLNEEQAIEFIDRRIKNCGADKGYNPITVQEILDRYNCDKKQTASNNEHGLDYSFDA